MYQVQNFLHSALLDCGGVNVAREINIKPFCLQSLVDTELLEHGSDDVGLGDEILTIGDA